MRKSLAQYTIAIPVPIPVFQQLCAHRTATGCREELSAMAGTAIVEWLERMNQPSTQGEAPVMNGYQWKDVYLPSGTLLRTVFNGANYHAIVKGDRIDYNGLSVSPSEFANAPGGGGRNAWRVLWVFFPNAQRWERADSFRDKRAEPRARRRASADGH